MTGLIGERSKVTGKNSVVAPSLATSWTVAGDGAPIDSVASDWLNVASCRISMPLTLGLPASVCRKSRLSSPSRTSKAADTIPTCWNPNRATGSMALKAEASTPSTSTSKMVSPTSEMNGKWLPMNSRTS